MNKRLTFPRSLRLISKQDFQFVFDRPFKSNCRHARAFFRPSQHVCARLGIVVAKTLIKRATDRILIKRLVRESFRQHQEVLKGLDIVVVIRSKCNPQKAQRDSCSTAYSGVTKTAKRQKIDKQSLRNDVDQLWQQILTNGYKRG